MPSTLPPADYRGCPVTVVEAQAAGRTLVAPRWGLWDVLIGLVGAVVIAIAVAVPLYLLSAPVAVQLIAGTVAPWAALAGWPALATARRGNGPVIDLGLRLTWADVGSGAVGGVVALVLATVAASITQHFVPDVSSAAADAAAEIEQSSSRLSVVVFALIVMVGAPVVEEAFFRGLFFAALRKRGAGPVVSVIATAVVFAAFHLEPVRFLILLPTGMVLGWVRWRTGSTGAAMVAHGLVNAPGAVLLLLGIDGMSP